MKLPYISKSGKTLIVPKEFVIYIFTEIQKKRIRKDLGICSNVHWKLGSMHAIELSELNLFGVERLLKVFIQETVKHWSFYSGDDNYPIPSENPRKSAKNYFYFSKRPKWRGHQGELRQDLLRHLIANAKPLRKKLRN